MINESEIRTMVGLRLKKYREQAGLTALQLTDKSYITVDTIRDIEKGSIKYQTMPRLSTLVTLANALNITLVQLVEGF